MTSQRAGDVRRLTPMDLSALTALVGSQRFTEYVLAMELEPGSPYRWVGVLDSGELCGAHRGLLWGDYLFLKGVFVDESARGTDAVLRLAFALRDVAWDAGAAGIAAWVSESSRPQVTIAQRLRLQLSAETLHLYSLSLPTGRQGKPASQPTFRSVRGEVTTDFGEEPLVADMLKDSTAPEIVTGEGRLRAPFGSRQSVSWVLDRDRIALSGLPCRCIDDFGCLLPALALIGAPMDIFTIELPVPATDFSLAIWLAAKNARRISQRPQKMGKYHFRSSREQLPDTHLSIPATTSARVR